MPGRTSRTEDEQDHAGEHPLSKTVTLAQGLYTIATFLILVLGPLVAGYLQLQQLQWTVAQHIATGSHPETIKRIEHLEEKSHADDLRQVRIDDKLNLIMDRLGIHRRSE